MLDLILPVVLIFGLRICDVSIGTLRVVLLVSGKRGPATALAFVESCIWVFAAAVVFEDLKEHPERMFAYAAGYAAGTLIGMTIEQYLAFGQQLVRVITRKPQDNMKELLAAEGYGVTSFMGEGVGGPVEELMIAIPRRRRKGLIKLVHTIDPQAFITVEAVNQILGGYIPRAWNDHGK